jgi:hypothetical protein
MENKEKQKIVETVNRFEIVWLMYFSWD